MIKRGKTQAEDTIERLEAQIKKIKGLQAELNELTSGLVTPEVVLKGAAITKRQEFWERDRVKKIAGRHRYKDSPRTKPVRHRTRLTCVIPRCKKGFLAYRKDAKYCSYSCFRVAEHQRYLDKLVEFRVKVPAGVRFLGRTVNGGIQASGLKADAEAQTVNGGVQLESTGTARAETVNGGIEARLGRADWEGALKLKTVNGGIDVVMPDGLSAEVKASTVNGDIQTDFPLTVSGRISKRKLQGTIGGGGRLLEMETVNGGIELRKAGAKERGGRGRQRRARK